MLTQRRRVFSSSASLRLCVRPQIVGLSSFSRAAWFLESHAKAPSRKELALHCVLATLREQENLTNRGVLCDFARNNATSKRVSEGPRSPHRSRFPRNPRRVPRSRFGFPSRVRWSSETLTASERTATMTHRFTGASFTSSTLSVPVAPFRPSRRIASRAPGGTGMMSETFRHWKLPVHGPSASSPTGSRSGP
jgi:hypothetical protein